MTDKPSEETARAPKPKGPHPHNRLNDKAAKAAKPGYHADGAGLYLKVDANGGARRWCLRVMVHGRRREVGLGGYPTVSLQRARELARELRVIAKEGGDPVAVRRERLQRAGVPAFEEAARKVHSDRIGSWKNAKHAAQWLSSLETYAFPSIGGRRVNEIHTPDVLAILSPIWLSRPETAKRIRQRIGAVMDWAKAAGHRSGDNPVDGVSKGLPAQPRRTKHLAALPYEQIPALVREIRELDVLPATRLALEFAILTAGRVNEVAGARFDEIDMENRTWNVPAERMKGKRPHRVPLSDRCMEILEEAREMGFGGPHVFPGMRPGRPLSAETPLQALQKIRPKMTVHGFRTGFRTWAQERAGFPSELAERALAHVIRDATIRAYARSDLFERRRDLMSAWSRYVTGSGAEIVALPTARKRA